MKSFILKCFVVFIFCLLLFRLTIVAFVNEYENKIISLTSSSNFTELKKDFFKSIKENNNKDSIIDDINFLTGGFSSIQMNGQEVYKFAVKEVPLILEKLLKKMKYNSDQVDWLLLHQANQRILDSVGERLKIPREKILSNLEKYGNTSAATLIAFLATSSAGISPSIKTFPAANA